MATSAAMHNRWELQLEDDLTSALFQKHVHLLCGGAGVTAGGWSAGILF